MLLKYNTRIISDIMAKSIHVYRIKMQSLNTGKRNEKLKWKFSEKPDDIGAFRNKKLKLRT